MTTMACFSHLKKVFLVTILIFASTAYIAAQTIWRGGSTDWTISGNWTNGVPTASSAVIIGDAAYSGSNWPVINVAAGTSVPFGTITIDVNYSAELTVQSGNLTGSGTVTVMAGMLRVSGASAKLECSNLIVNGGTVVEVTGGAELTAGSLTDTGSLGLVNGKLNVNGPFTINGGSLALNNSADLVKIAGDFNNSPGMTGYIYNTSGGEIEFSGTGSINDRHNQNLGKVTISGNRQLGWGTAVSSIEITGTLDLNGHALDVTVGDCTVSGTLTATASGSVTVASGNVDASLGTLTSNSGVLMSISTASMILASNKSANNIQGQLRLTAGGNISVEQVLSLNLAEVNSTAGGIIFDTDHDIQVGANITLAGSGSVSFKLRAGPAQITRTGGTITANRVNFNAFGGTDIEINSSRTISGSILITPAVLQNISASTVHIDYLQTHLATSAAVNLSTTNYDLEIEAPSIIASNNFKINAAKTLKFTASGSITATGSGSIEAGTAILTGTAGIDLPHANSVSNLFINNGSGSTGTAVFNNNKALTLAAAQGSGSLTVSAAGNITANNVDSGFDITSAGGAVSLTTSAGTIALSGGSIDTSTSSGGSSGTVTLTAAASITIALGESIKTNTANISLTANGGSGTISAGGSIESFPTGSTTTVSTGQIVLNGKVQIPNDIYVSSSNGVQFMSTIDGPQKLTVYVKNTYNSNAVIKFEGAIGGTTPLSGIETSSVLGGGTNGDAITISGGLVKTNGAQNWSYLAASQVRVAATTVFETINPGADITVTNAINFGVSGHQYDVTFKTDPSSVISAYQIGNAGDSMKDFTLIGGTLRVVGFWVFGDVTAASNGTLDFSTISEMTVNGDWLAANMQISGQTNGQIIFTGNNATINPPAAKFPKVVVKLYVAATSPVNISVPAGSTLKTAQDLVIEPDASYPSTLTINASGTIEVDGDIKVGTGSSAFNGTLILGSGVSAIKVRHVEIENDGVLTIADNVTMNVYGRWSTAAASTMTVDPTSLVTFLGDQQAAVNEYTITLNNSTPQFGTIIFNAGNDSYLIATDIYAAGNITLANGKIRRPNGQSNQVTIESGGTFQQSGGNIGDNNAVGGFSIIATGEIKADYKNSGVPVNECRKIALWVKSNAPANSNISWAGAAASLTLLGGSGLGNNAVKNESTGGIITIENAGDIVIDTSQQIVSINGTITIKTTAALGSIQFNSSAQISAAASITITLIMDMLSVAPTAGINAGTSGTVIIEPFTMNRPIALYSSTSGSLSLPSALFTQTTTGTMSIGSVNGSGSFTIAESGAIACSYDLVLQSPAGTGTMTFSNNALNASGKTVTLNMGAAGTIVTTKTTGNDIVAQTLFITAANNAGSTTNPIRTNIASLGASTLTGSLYLTNAAACNIAGAVQINAASGVLSIAAGGNLTQAVALGGYEGRFSVSSGDILLAAYTNVFTRVALTSTTAAASQVQFKNAKAGGLTAAATTTSANLTLEETTGDLEIGTVNAVTRITAGGTANVVLTAPASTQKIVLAQGVTAAGMATFNAPVRLASGADLTISGGATTPASIVFTGTVDAFANGNGKLALAAAGTVKAPGAFGQSAAFERLVINSGNAAASVFTNDTGSSMFIKAQSFEIGQGSSANTTITTAGSTNNDITFQVDEIYVSGTVAINATTAGNFQIYPMTASKKIDYAPIDNFRNLGTGEITPTDVYYSPNWNFLTAKEFILGDASHQGDIFLRCVGTSYPSVPVTVVDYPLTVRNGGDKSIIVMWGYTSNQKTLSLQPGSGGVVLDGAYVDSSNMFVTSGSSRIDLTGGSAVTAATPSFELASGIPLYVKRIGAVIASYTTGAFIKAKDITLNTIGSAAAPSTSIAQSLTLYAPAGGGVYVKGVVNNLGLFVLQGKTLTTDGMVSSRAMDVKFDADNAVFTMRGAGAFAGTSGSGYFKQSKNSFNNTKVVIDDNNAALGTVSISSTDDNISFDSPVELVDSLALVTWPSAAGAITLSDTVSTTVSGVAPSFSITGKTITTHTVGSTSYPLASMTLTLNQSSGSWSAKNSITLSGNFMQTNSGSLSALQNKIEETVMITTNLGSISIADPVAVSMDKDFTLSAGSSASGAITLDSAVTKTGVGTTAPALALVGKTIVTHAVGTSSDRLLSMGVTVNQAGGSWTGQGSIALENNFSQSQSGVLSGIKNTITDGNDTAVPVTIEINTLNGNISFTDEIELKDTLKLTGSGTASSITLAAAVSSSAAAGREPSLNIEGKTISSTAAGSAANPLKDMSVRFLQNASSWTGTGNIYLIGAFDQTSAGGSGHTVQLGNGSAISMSSTGTATAANDGAKISFTTPLQLGGALTLTTSAQGNYDNTIYLNGASGNFPLMLTANKAPSGSGTGKVQLGSTIDVGTVFSSFNPANNAFVVTTGDLAITAGVSISTHNFGNIVFKVDQTLTLSNNPISAGSGPVPDYLGNFQISPQTVSKTIEYGDSDTAVSTDVFYQALWSNITAKNFIVGDSNHVGAIYVSATGATIPTPYAVQFVTKATPAPGSSTEQRVIFTGSYHSADKSITMDTWQIELNGTLNIDLQAAGATETAQWSANVPVLLTGAASSAVSITAKGGILFQSTIKSDINGSAATSHALTLDSGAAALTITGAAGEASMRLGALALTGEVITTAAEVFATSMTVTVNKLTNTPLNRNRYDAQGNISLSESGFTQLAGTGPNAAPQINLGGAAAFQLSAKQDILLNDAVILKQNTTLTSSDGSVKLLAVAPVNGSAAAAESLVISAAGSNSKVELNGAVGGGTPLASITVTAASSALDAIKLGGNITTGMSGLAGDQTYTGMIKFTTSAVLNSNNGDITVNDNIDANGLNITVNAGTGDAYFGGEAGTIINKLNNFAVTGANITLCSAYTNIGQSYTGALTLPASPSQSQFMNNAGGDIVFSSTINGSTAGAEILVINAGNSKVNFGGAVGNLVSLASLSVTSTYGASDAIRLQSVSTGVTAPTPAAGLQTYTGNVTLAAATTTLISNGGNIQFFNNINAETAGVQALVIGSSTLPSIAGNVGFNGQTGNVAALKSITITAASFLANGNITTAAGGDIDCRVDGLMVSTAIVNAGNGTGDFKIAPSDPVKTVEYGDSDSSIPTDVYYQSSWSSMNVKSFVVGNNDQIGAIYISSVTNTSFPVKFQTKTNDPGAFPARHRVIFFEDYSSQDQPVEISTWNLEIDSGSTSRSINLGSALWHSSVPAKLTGTAGVTTTASINAGVITFDDVIIADQDGRRSLNLNAASGAITLNGALGTSSVMLNIVSLTHSNTLDIDSNVFAKGGLTEIGLGTVNLGGNITTVNSDIIFNNAINGTTHIAFITGDTATKNGGSLQFKDDISANGYSIDFNTLGTGAAAGTAGKVYINPAGSELTLGAKNITFYGEVTDENPLSAGTYLDKKLNVIIPADGLLALESTNLFSLYQNATVPPPSTPFGAVEIGARSPVNPAAPVTIRTRSTASLTFYGTITLKNHTYFYDEKGGIISFHGAVFSDEGQFFNLKIETNGTAPSPDDLYFFGDVGDGTINPALSKRLGKVELIAAVIHPNNVSIFANDEIHITRSGGGAAVSYVTINGKLEVDARDIGTQAAKNILLHSDTVQRDKLVVRAGSFNIQTNNYLLSNAVSAPADGFNAESGTTLDLRAGASFVVGSGTNRNFIMQSGATLAAPASALVKMEGMGIINLGTVITRAANGQITVVNAGQSLGSFELGASALVSAQSDLIVRGDWTAPPGASPFTPNSKTVLFTGESGYNDITISGNTLWYNFAAEGPYLNTIYFSNWTASGDAHTFTQSITIRGTASKRITLNSVLAGSTPNPPYSTPPPTPDGNFWVIDVSAIPVGGYLFEYINVYHSYAYPAVISVDPGLVTTSSKAPYWTINWKREFFYVYSFTEDSDGDGKIDRIRIQPNVTALGSRTGDFSGFKIEVEGYRVTGYGTLGGAGGIDTFPAPYIYVKVEPDPAQFIGYDGNARPVWYLVNPGGIMDDVSHVGIGTPDGFIQKAVDTVPPRLLYTLTHPDTGELYLKFSEPLASATWPSSLSIGSKTYTSPGSGGDNVSLLYATSDGAWSAAALAGDLRYDDEALFSVLTDVPAQGWPDQPVLEAPVDAAYPSSVNYGSYDMVDLGNPFPGSLVTSPFDIVFNANGGMRYQTSPDTLWANSRRVGDLILLAQPPAASAASSIWPNYAVNALSSPEAPHSLVNQWDGSKALIISRDWSSKSFIADINVFVRDAISPQLLSPPALVYACDVPNEYRHNEADGNLWLPQINSGPADIALHFVPQYFNTVGYASSLQNAPDYLYNPKSNTIKNQGTLDFIFKMPLSPTSPALYAVRMDYKAQYWYESFKPFTFAMQDIVRQRGGVTIIDNVINPERDNKTKINYVLTRGGPVTINVFTLDGNVVRTLYRGRRDAGEYFAEWDGRNNKGAAVARGIYFIRVVAPDIDEMRKVMVVK